MKTITIKLTDKRFAALEATAALHLPEGTAEEYANSVMNAACDSYAQTVETVAAQVYKERAERAEAELQTLKQTEAVMEKL